MKYAVIRLAGRPFRVSEGDKLKVNRISPERISDEIRAGKGGGVDVLLYVDDKTRNIGMPPVEGVGVELKVLEDKKDKKISVRRFRGKSRYRKKRGHRQPVSILEVVSIGKGKNKIVGLDVVSDDKQDNAEAQKAEEPQKKTIEDLGLSNRSANALTKASIKTEAQLKKLKKEDLDKIKGLGAKSIEEILKVVS